MFSLDTNLACYSYRNRIYSSFHEIMGFSENGYFSATQKVK